MFACLFGNSRKVIENLKKIPIDNNVVIQNNIDLAVLEYINNISLKCHYFAKYNAGLPHK